MGKENKAKSKIVLSTVQNGVKYTTVKFAMFVLMLLVLVTKSVYSKNTKDTVSVVKSSFELEIGTGISTSDQMPFWIRSLQYGTIPLKSNFSYINSKNSLQISNKIKRRVWNNELETLLIFQNGLSLILPIINTSYKNKNIEIFVGRKKEVYGLYDTTMSVGSYIWSGNSLPIPKIQISTNGFKSIYKDIISLNVTLAHGWFGKENFAYNYFLHQKTFYIKIGKNNNKVNIYTGISHFAQWGGYAPVLIGLNRTLPDGSLPKSFKDFLYIITAKNMPQSGNLSQFDNENRLGNHIGSIDLAINIKNKNNSWLIYTQHPVENAPGLWNNFPDGIYGIRWVNQRKSNKIGLKQITFDKINLLNQGIVYNDRYGYQINDYFNNSQYMDGWSYRNNVIGIPLITQRSDTRLEWFNNRGLYANKDYQQINGNYISSTNIAALIKYNPSIEIKLRASYSSYYKYDGNGKFINPIKQFSASFDLKKEFIKTKTSFQLIASLDRGEWLNNKSGILLKFQKKI